MNITIYTIPDLKEFLINYFKNRKVKIYLFGSRARSDNSRFSDIDIAFLPEEDISRDLVIIKEIIEESYLPYKVDLVDLSKSTELIEVVLKEGVRWL